MRIAIFTNNYLPNPYGVSTSIETFRRDFEKLGHEVFIFAPHWPGYKDENKNVFRYPSVDIEIKFRFPLAIPYSIRMDRMIGKMNFDIIHAHHPNLLGTAAMKWARKKKVPLVFTWHTLYDQYTNFVPVIPPSVSAKFMISKAVKYANHCDTVVVPTDSITKILRHWGVKNKIMSVATGVVEGDFENADRETIRKKYHIDDNDTVLILITRLTGEKNIEFLFDAVKDILKGKKNIKFILGGGGYLASKIKELTRKEGLGDQVILPGVIKREEIKNYLASGDIMVDASKSETQGMHVSEAMYMGLPIVAVNATGTNSLVLNNGNGFLVREDKKEFKKAVERLISDYDLRKKFSEVSKKIARENFTSAVTAKRMLAVYENCINQ